MIIMVLNFSCEIMKANEKFTHDVFDWLEKKKITHFVILFVDRLEELSRIVTSQLWSMDWSRLISPWQYIHCLWERKVMLCITQVSHLAGATEVVVIHAENLMIIS